MKNGDFYLAIQYPHTSSSVKLKEGFLTQGGKEEPHKMYCGGTIFVDHRSSKMDVLHQVLFGVSDTIRSKDIHEPKSEEVVVKIKKYRGDNGIYKSTEFKSKIAARVQLFGFSVVNRVAKRGIQTVVNSARIVILHQALLWPYYFDICLWPFALAHSAYLWNYLPNGNID